MYYLCKVKKSKESRNGPDPGQIFMLITSKIMCYYKGDLLNTPEFSKSAIF